MSGNSFDLRELRRKPTTVYLHVPANRRGTARLLINIFFSQLIEISTETTPDRDRSLKLQVLLLLDEFPSLGKVSAISDSIAYLAGYNFGCSRSRRRIRSLSRSTANTWRTTSWPNGLQVLYTPRGLRDSEEYSKRLGTADFETSSRSRSHSYGESSSSSSRPNRSVKARALLMPQEFRAMSFEKEVIDLEGCRPIDARKIVYWKDERFANRLFPPPDVPALGLGLHRSRLEGRVKTLSTVTDVRTTPIEALDLNLHGLELPLDPTPKQITAFNKAYYDRERATPEPALDDEAESEAREASEPTPSLS